MKNFEVKKNENSSFQIKEFLEKKLIELNSRGIFINQMGVLV